MNTHDGDKNDPEWMHMPVTAASLGMTEEELEAMVQRRCELDAVGMSEDALHQRAAREILVLLDVEYCHETYFWFPGMQAGSFEAWWRHLDTVIGYWWDAYELPGLVVREQRDQCELWCSLRDSGRYYKAYIHMDDDSGLVTPEGRTILHKGYSGY